MVVMRGLIPIVLLLAFGISVTASCVVRDGRPGRTVVRERRSCPPSYHWEGNDCVHNGKGHNKHKDKDKHHKKD